MTGRLATLAILLAGCEPEPPPPSPHESTMQALRELEAQKNAGTAAPRASDSETRVGGPGSLVRSVHAFYRSWDGSASPKKGDLEIAVVFDHDRTNLHAFAVGRGSRILGVVPATPPGGPEVALTLGQGGDAHTYGLPAGTPSIRAVRLVPTDGSPETSVTVADGMRSHTDYLPAIAEGRALFVTLELEGTDTILYPIVRGGPGLPNVPAGAIERGDVPKRVSSSLVYLEDLRRVQDWLRSDRSGPYPLRGARTIE